MYYLKPGPDLEGCSTKEPNDSVVENNEPEYAVESEEDTSCTDEEGNSTDVEEESDSSTFGSSESLEDSVSEEDDDDTTCEAIDENTKYSSMKSKSEEKSSTERERENCNTESNENTNLGCMEFEEEKEKAAGADASTESEHEEESYDSFDEDEKTDPENEEGSSSGYDEGSSGSENETDHLTDGTDFTSSKQDLEAENFIDEIGSETSKSKEEVNVISVIDAIKNGKEEKAVDDGKSIKDNNCYQDSNEGEIKAKEDKSSEECGESESAENTLEFKRNKTKTDVSDTLTKIVENIGNQNEADIMKIEKKSIRNDEEKDKSTRCENKTRNFENGKTGENLEDEKETDTNKSLQDVEMAEVMMKTDSIGNTIQIKSPEQNQKEHDSAMDTKDIKNLDDENIKNGTKAVKMQTKVELKRNYVKGTEITTSEEQTENFENKKTIKNRNDVIQTDIAKDLKQIETTEVEMETSENTIESDNTKNNKENLVNPMDGKKSDNVEMVKNSRNKSKADIFKQQIDTERKNREKSESTKIKPQTGTLENKKADEGVEGKKQTDTTDNLQHIETDEVKMKADSIKNTKEGTSAERNEKEVDIAVHDKKDKNLGNENIKNGTENEEKSDSTEKDLQVDARKDVDIEKHNGEKAESTKSEEQTGNFENEETDENVDLKEIDDTKCLKPTEKVEAVEIDSSENLKDSVEDMEIDDSENDEESEVKSDNSENEGKRDCSESEEKNDNQSEESDINESGCDESEGENDSTENDIKVDVRKDAEIERNDGEEAESTKSEESGCHESEEESDTAENHIKVDVRKDVEIERNNGEEAESMKSEKQAGNFENKEIVKSIEGDHTKSPRPVARVEIGRKIDSSENQEESDDSENDMESGNSRNEEESGDSGNEENGNAVKENSDSSESEEETGKGRNDIKVDGNKESYDSDDDSDSSTFRMDTGSTESEKCSDEVKTASSESRTFGDNSQGMSVDVTESNIETSDSEWETESDSSQDEVNFQYYSTKRESDASEKEVKRKISKSKIVTNMVEEVSENSDSEFSNVKDDTEEESSSADDMEESDSSDDDYSDFSENLEESDDNDENDNSKSEEESESEEESKISETEKNLNNFENPKKHIEVEEQMEGSNVKVIKLGEETEQNDVSRNVPRTDKLDQNSTVDSNIETENVLNIKTGQNEAQDIEIENVLIDKTERNKVEDMEADDVPNRKKEQNELSKNIARTHKLDLNSAVDSNIETEQMDKTKLILYILRRYYHIAVVKRRHVLGAASFRVFPGQNFCELAFYGTHPDESCKGIASLIMAHLKEFNRVCAKVTHLVACVPEPSVGYFLKQGFSREVTLPLSICENYLERPNQTTVLEFLINEDINYYKLFLQWPLQHEILKRMIELYKKGIDSSDMTSNSDLHNVSSNGSKSKPESNELEPRLESVQNNGANIRDDQKHTDMDTDSSEIKFKKGSVEGNGLTEKSKSLPQSHPDGKEKFLTESLKKEEKAADSMQHVNDADLKEEINNDKGQHVTAGVSAFDTELKEILGSILGRVGAVKTRNKAKEKIGTKLLPESHPGDKEKRLENAKNIRLASELQRKENSDVKVKGNTDGGQSITGGASDFDTELGEILGSIIGRVGVMKPGTKAEEKIDNDPQLQQTVLERKEIKLMTESYLDEREKCHNESLGPKKTESSKSILEHVEKVDAKEKSKIDEDKNITGGASDFDTELEVSKSIAGRGGVIKPRTEAGEKRIPELQETVLEREKTKLISESDKEKCHRKAKDTSSESQIREENAEVSKAILEFVEQSDVKEECRNDKSQNIINIAPDLEKCDLEELLKSMIEQVIKKNFVKTPETPVRHQKLKVN
ncbi:myb-like protein X [Uloborus diversus]|uniref:myb-like protein X n=1 Tax=Uloborus diversus TaxID=327109 RepID=UPI00240A3236|nr:myb-like protein X [Uloborus diversus]